MDISIFSRRLKEARRAKDFTQAQLAKQSGVTAATISAYESTDSKKGCNPSLENAAKLAEALSVSLDWLCGSAANKSKVETVDFLRMLVKMSENIAVSVDNVDLIDDKSELLLKNACNTVIDEDEYTFLQDYCESVGEKFKYTKNFLAFGNNYIDKFLTEWQKMKALYNSNTIDKELYEFWLDKQFSDIEQKEKEDEEHRKELEKALLQGGD
nr:helix-turn-helix transcriptional regulator [uncultured Ruminococcus sp.]